MNMLMTAEDEKTMIHVELYENMLTQQSGDYTGRIRSTGTLYNKQIAARIVKERSEYRQETIENILSIADRIKCQALAEGKNINDGVGQYTLGVQGSFVGEDAPFNQNIHSIAVNFVAGKELRTMLKNVKVETAGIATTGPVVNAVFDTMSDTENGTLTAGGPVVISGRNIKIVGDDPSVGITLTADDETRSTLKITTLVHNNPSQITAILPKELDDTKGYYLDVTTQFCQSGKKLIKTPRTYRFPVKIGNQDDDRPVIE